MNKLKKKRRAQNISEKLTAVREVSRWILHQRKSTSE